MQKLFGVFSRRRDDSRQRIALLAGRPNTWVILILAGLVTYSVGMVASSALERHNDVVVTTQDQMCDSGDDFFNSCYSFNRSEFAPPLTAISIAPPPAPSFCFGYCPATVWERPPGSPQIDAWSTSDCRILAVSIGGRPHGTALGWVFRVGVGLIVVAGLLLLTGQLSSIRRQLREGVIQRVGETAGLAAQASIASAIVLTQSTWPLGKETGTTGVTVLLVLLGVALVGLVVSLGALIVSIIRQRGQPKAQHSGRSWLVPLISISVVAISGFYVVFGIRPLGC
jgi:hypothetical protein